jgi:hypothetical protein
MVDLLFFGDLPPAWERSFVAIGSPATGDPAKGDGEQYRRHRQGQLLAALSRSRVSAFPPRWGPTTNPRS